MNHWYFIVGAVILLISVILIVICMMQEQKPQNATAALSGASNDSFYDKNRGSQTEEDYICFLRCIFCFDFVCRHSFAASDKVIGSKYPVASPESTGHFFAI